MRSSLLVLVVVILSISSSSLASTLKEKEKGNGDNRSGNSDVPALGSITQIMFKRNCDDSCNSFESRFLANQIAFWTGATTEENKDGGSYQASLSNAQFNHLVQILFKKGFFTMEETTGDENQRNIEVGAVWKNTQGSGDVIKFVRIYDNSLAQFEATVDELHSVLDWIPIPAPVDFVSISKHTWTCVMNDDNAEEDCSVSKLELHHQFAIVETTQGTANLIFPESHFHELAFSFITNGFFIMDKEYGKNEQEPHSPPRAIFIVEYHPIADYSETERKAVAIYGPKFVTGNLANIERDLVEGTKDLVNQVNLFSYINSVGLVLSGLTLCILIATIVIGIKVLRSKNPSSDVLDYNPVKDVELKDSPILVFKKDRPIL